MFMLNGVTRFNEPSLIDRKLIIAIGSIRFNPYFFSIKRKLGTNVLVNQSAIEDMVFWQKILNNVIQIFVIMMSKEIERI
jgi:hypothetical protein